MDVTLLHAVRARLGLSDHDAWVGYFAVGGNATVAQVASWLSGAVAPAAREYDLMAQSVNDASVDLGLDHPVPYAASRNVDT